VASRRRLHPTQKPTDLLAHLVSKHCPPTGLVLDPFVGAGATLLAARALGRRAIGIELDERFCRIAAERLQAPSRHQGRATPAAQLSA
jgi:DNA modification methylase